MFVLKDVLLNVHTALLWGVPASTFYTEVRLIILNANLSMVSFI